MTDISRVIPQRNITFMSPHFDDVPLTFGGYLLALGANNLLSQKSITIVNSFSRTVYQARDTKGNRDTSLARIQFATGIRLIEDLNCLDELIGHGNYRYELLGERECTVRQKAWKPGEAFEFPWGNRQSFDAEENGIYLRLKEDVRKRLADPDTALCCPMAMKEHVDHVIQREAIADAARELGAACKAAVYFAEDQPYTGLASEQDWETASRFLKSEVLEAVDYAIDLEAKVAMVMHHYPSQVEDSYRQGMLARARELARHNGAAAGLERIYRRIAR